MNAYGESSIHSTDTSSRRVLPSPSVLLRGDGAVVVAAREHSSGDACQLVGHGDDNDVFRHSGVECIEPGSNRWSIAFDPQHGCSRTMNQDLARVDVASLTDAEQLRLTAGRILARHDAEPCRELSTLAKGDAVTDGSNDGCRAFERM
jgi:hypothetical protein